MFTTAPIRSPVAPRQPPPRTCSANAAMRSSTSCTAATTSSPPTSMRAARGARSAVCSTGRCSETLIGRRAASPRCARAAPPARPAHEQVERLAGQALLGEVEQDAEALGAEPLRAAGSREQLGQRGGPAASRRARAAHPGRQLVEPRHRRPGYVRRRAPRAWRRSSRAARVHDSTKASAPSRWSWARARRRRSRRARRRRAPSRPRPRRPAARARRRAVIGDGPQRRVGHRVDRQRRERARRRRACRTGSGPSCPCSPTAGAAAGRRRSSSRSHAVRAQQVAVGLVARAPPTAIPSLSASSSGTRSCTATSQRLMNSEATEQTSGAARPRRGARARAGRRRPRRGTGRGRTAA